MKRIINYEINSDFHNHSIEYFLKTMGFPHGVIVQLKKTPEGILLNGNWAYTRDKLSLGDKLCLTLTENCEPSDIVPIAMDLDIVYEDEDILVVNKPADMPVHPSQNNYENTLANGIMHYFSKADEGFVYRCINRLDRDTTGLTIIAKNSLSGAILGRQVASKELKRKYIAICQGQVQSSGIIDAPIGRVSGSTIERQVDYEKGESAITHYRLIKYNPTKDLSLVELELKTGRTHQIRVHMKSIGHPLIGDFLYNPDYSYIKRQALHSAELSFTHPVTNKKMQLHSQLPLDMQCIL